jgi:hypothetical protein
VTATLVETLAQLQASDPSKVYGNEPIRARPDAKGRGRVSRQLPPGHACTPNPIARRRR